MIEHTSLRAARRSDLPTLVTLCAQHAAYEQADYNPTGKATALEQALFCTAPPLSCWVAERHGKVVGYVTYMRQFSTWEATTYLYMDCLFLTEACRGHGIGERLIEQVKIAAMEQGCTEVQWQTPTFNQRAMKFYRRIGAVGKTKERYFLAVPSIQE